MAIFFKSADAKEKETLNEPYVKVRHIAIFDDEEEAINAAKRLNYNIYHPLGLTKDEMKTLFDEERSLFGIKKIDDKYSVIERTVY